MAKIWKIKRLFRCCILVLILDILICGAVRKKKQVLILQKLQDCYTNKTTLGNFDASGLVSLDKQNMTLKIKSNIHQNFPSEMEVSWKVYKCKDSTWVDCEYYTNLRQKHFCNFMKTPLGIIIWRETFNSFQPPFSCPFKKGTYTALRFNFNPVLQDIIFSLFNVEDKSFMSEIKLLSTDNKILICSKIFLKNTYIVI